MRIGYAPYSPTLSNPSDRRRFPHYAAIRGLQYDIVRGVSRDYDLVILSSKADIVAWRTRKPARTKVAYELIDSYLALPSKPIWWAAVGAGKAARREIARPVLNYRRAIEAMCEEADAVVCSCPEQRQMLQALNDRVYDILDFSDEVEGTAKVDYRGAVPAVLVWEGLCYSVKHLRVLAPVLAQLAGTVSLRVVTDPAVPRIGSRYLPRPTTSLLKKYLPQFDLRQWDRTSMPVEVTACDIAVIPIDLSDPMARAKPENKLMILWHLGMPVVASATPAYRRCMDAAGLELACESVEDWVRALQGLLEGPEARRAAATAGANYVTGHCSSELIAARWDKLLADLMGRA